MISRTDLINGLMTYIVSSFVVTAAVVFGFYFTRINGDYPNFDHWDALNRYDGGFYRDIAARGYCWNQEFDSVMAFFPLYPILIRAGTEATDARQVQVAPVISHLFLAISFVLLHAYFRRRSGDAKLASLSVLALAVIPTGFFFRLGYSESTFLLITSMFLIALESRCSIWIPALIAGFATGTRAPGLALSLVFMFELWKRYPSLRRFLPRAALLGPVCCFGLLAFVIHQWTSFGDPLAFIKVQERWGRVNGNAGDIVVALATYEPAWGTYVSDSPRYWRANEHHDFAVFSLVYANPFFFTATLLLILWGARSRWLKGNEIILALALLAIPYFTKGFSNSMGSFGRFAAVVVPVYLVLGRLLALLPPLALGLIIVISTFWLVVYASMFGAGWALL